MKKHTFIVLGGYGEMGQVIVRDLFETTKDRIFVAGRDPKKAQAFAKSFRGNRIRGFGVDVQNEKSLVRLLKKGDVVINAVQYYFNLDVMKAALKARISYIDLGGLFHMTRKQLKLHRAFQKAGVLAILGCGATPGITNIMAAYGAEFLDRISEIHVKFAGKDFTTYNQPFVLPYSAQTLFDEFNMKAAVFRKGKWKMVKALSEGIYENFPPPIGKVFCMNTLHSELATFPLIFRSKGIRECTFKGGFDISFVKIIQTFYQMKSRSLAISILNSFLPKPESQIKDFEDLRVTLKGQKNGKNKTIILDCFVKSKPKWNAGAGTVDTAVSPSIIAQMIVQDRIQKKKGVFPPETCIPSLPFFQELAKRDIKVSLKKI